MKKNIFSLLFCLFCFSIISFAQTDKDYEKWSKALETETDTVKRVNLYTNLAGYYGYVDVRKTLEYADSALQLAKKGNYKKGEAVAYLRKGQALHEMKNPFGAFAYFTDAEITFIDINDTLGEYITKSNKKAMTFAIGLMSADGVIINQTLDTLKIYARILIAYEDSAQVSMNYHNVAIGYAILEEFDMMSNTTDSVQKYLSLAQQYNLSDKNLDYFEGIVEIQKGAVWYFNYKRTGEQIMLDNAEKAYQKVFEIFKKLKNTEDVEQLFIAQGDLASIYFSKGNYFEAFQLSKEQLNLANNVRNLYKKGLFYRNLGAHYFEIGDLDRGKKFTKAAEEYTGINTEVYLNLGISYCESNQLEKAKEYLYDLKKNELFTIPEEQLKNNKQKGLLLYGRGLYQQKLSNYNGSIELLKKSSEILEKKDKRWFAMATYQLGISYVLRGDLDTGETFIKKSIYTLKDKKGFKTEKSIFENGLGELYATSNNLDTLEMAMLAYQRAISYTISENIVFDTPNLSINPLDSNIAQKNVAIIPIANKGKVLIKKYELYDDIESLKLGIESLELAVKLLDNLRLYYDGNSNTINTINDKLSFIFDDLIKAYFILSSVQQPQSIVTQNNLKNAFRVAEKSKSYVLFSALVKMNPPKLKTSSIEGKDNLIETLHLLNKNILNQKADDNTELSKENKALKEKIYSTIQRTDSIFFDYMYKPDVIKIDLIQHQLANNQAIIEYYKAADAIYCFVITKSSFNTYQMPLDLIADVTNLDNCMRKQFYDKDLTIRQKRLEDANFAKYSYRLYETLLKEPIRDMPKDINRLVIVPTDVLHGLSFDVLLQEEPTTEKFTFDTLQYLIKNYAISYVHSATILSELNKMESESSSKVQIFAPSYPKQKTADNNLQGTNTDDCEEIFKNLTSLSFEQANVINTVFPDNSTYWKSADATKETFIKNCSTPSAALFLSMHGCIDKNAAQSRLLFSGAQSYTDTANSLSVAEIYNLNIQAKIVVLNACVTGKGTDISKSEGFSSIARAFQYAGCPSVVMSRWAVSENASIKMMKYFSENIADGETVDVALQQAKLEYLKPNNGIDLKLKKPFYWSVFVSLGRTTPIFEEE